MARTNLKVFRVSKNLTLESLAERIDYGRATVAAIENGKREGRKAFWNAIKAEFNLDDDTIEALKVND